MKSKVKTVVTALVAAGVLGSSGAAIATAESTPSASTAQTTTSASSTWNGTHTWGEGMHGHGTPVTGATLTQVKNVVASKYPGVTLKHAFKTAKGSYVAVGTKSGVRETFRVSSNFQTVTEHAHAAGHDRAAGQAGHRHGTPVTGATLTQVKNAVASKYPGVTLKHAFKTPQGSYVAVGTKSGVRETFRVTSNFQTVTEHTHAAAPAAS